MGGQPGKPKPPGNPPIRQQPQRPQPIKEPPQPLPVPPVDRPPAPIHASQERRVKPPRVQGAAKSRAKFLAFHDFGMHGASHLTSIAWAIARAAFSSPGANIAESGTSYTITISQRHVRNWARVPPMRSSAGAAAVRPRRKLNMIKCLRPSRILP